MNVENHSYAVSLAESFGEEFIQSAKELCKAKIKSAKLVTIDEMCNIFGVDVSLHETSKGVMDELKQKTYDMGFRIDQVGIFCGFHESYILDEPFVCFVISDYVEFFDKNIAENFDGQSHKSAIRLYGERIFLGEMLSRMSSQTKFTADEKFSHLKGKVPFVITEGGL